MHIDIFRSVEINLSVKFKNLTNTGVSIPGVMGLSLDIVKTKTEQNNDMSSNVLSKQNANRFQRT